MTAKIIGAGMILSASMLCAYRIAAAHRKEGQALRSLRNSLDLIRWELEERRSPLPTLFQAASSRADTCVGRFFAALADELSAQIQPDGASCVRAALLRCGDIPEQTRMILQNLGNCLGCFDIEGQLSGIRAAIHECDRAIEGQSTLAAEKCRSMQALCLCVGAALAICFL